ncbi:MAG TPA: hypothetical protein VNQ77_17515 [Frankiaceae bacterium]|nr:hypothetical protein [Frankiaceae bacterium]
MPPRVRKAALTAHVTASVGWLGAVTAFLAPAVAGVTSDDAETVRGVRNASDLLGRYVVLPFCVASLLTGLVQSLGTTWGLFRHYWVTKLVVNVFATVVLVLVATVLSVFKPRGLTPYGWRVTRQ